MRPVVLFPHIFTALFLLGSGPPLRFPGWIVFLHSIAHRTERAIVSARSRFAEITRLHRSWAWKTRQTVRRRCRILLSRHTTKASHISSTSVECHTAGPKRNVADFRYLRHFPLSAERVWGVGRLAKGLAPASVLRTVIGPYRRSEVVKW